MLIVVLLLEELLELAEKLVDVRVLLGEIVESLWDLIVHLLFDAAILIKVEARGRWLRVLRLVDASLILTELEAKL